MTEPGNDDDPTIWARPTEPAGLTEPIGLTEPTGPAAPPTVAIGPDPTMAAGPYPPPHRNRRIAVIAGIAAVVVAAIVTTVVILVSGPSVDDVAGTWTQRQSMIGMGVDQTLVVSGDRFTYTFAITAGSGDDTSGIIGGLLGPLLGTGGMSAGVQCAGKVEVDGDRFVFASDTGPCATIYGTLHGRTLTLQTTGSQPNQVDLVHE